MTLNRVFFLSLVLVLMACKERDQHDKFDLNVIDFERHINREDVYLLDVRTPKEVSGGRIEGAVFLNILEPEFMESYDSLPKKKTIYIYCESGVRSRKAVAFLIEQGFDSVYHLNAGIKAWKKANKKIKF